MIILDSHTQDSDPDRRGHATRARLRLPFVTNAEAWDHVIALLDQGVTELQGGAAFPFTLPAGFTGFNTPATFLKFNRALRARVAVYRGDLRRGAHLPRRNRSSIPRRRSTLGSTWTSAPARVTSPNPLAVELADQRELRASVAGDPGATPAGRSSGPALPGQAGEAAVAVRRHDEHHAAPAFSSDLGWIRYPSPELADPADQERGADSAPGGGQHRT